MLLTVLERMDKVAVSRAVSKLIKTERIIGHKRGTGGSSGVPFLKKALEAEFFPELIRVRTEIEGTQ